MSVAIVLYEGCSAYEALGALAACRAADVTAELHARDALVPTREGARVVPARLGYEALGAADAAVLPSGDTKRALADAELAKALRARRGHWLLAAGPAIRIAAAAGLTDGRRVATPPDDAPPPGAHAQHARLVADGRLLTSHAGDALIDLVLHYLGRAHGEPASRRAADALGREHHVYAMGAADGK